MNDTSTSFMRRLAVPLAAALVLAGCSLTPRYERPAAPVPAHWPGAQPAEGGPAEDQAQTLAAPDLPWEQFVQDERLREIIRQALQNNRDLRVARHSVEQMRASYQIARANQFPTLGASGSYTRSAPATMPGGASVHSSASLSVGITAWEIDFFGRIAALKQAALAQYLATEEAQKNTQISLIAAISSAWLSLQTHTELLALAERTLATREESLKLTRLRLDNGVATALDMRQAESLAAAARASRAEQKRLRAEDLSNLALLAGQPIAEQLLPKADETQLSGFADVPAGLSSDVLLRRPDIRQAEQQLIAANANIGAARAAYFPTISLTAGLGRASSDLDGLFGSGGQRAWNFAPAISLPIFDMGRNRAGVESAQAARDIAVARYEKAIQTAFKEVADALTARQALAEQLQAQQQQTDAERERYRLVDLSYRNGVANSLDLLDAQRSLFGVEQALAQTRLAQRANEITLYKALGGGWSQTQPESDQKQEKETSKE